MSETNSEAAESVTTFMTCILIDGKEILPDIFRNEEIMKGILVGGTHVEPKIMHALNETTFLVTYSSDSLAEEIGTIIEKIGEWFGKPVVIMCDKVTSVQLPQVIECVCSTTGVESVVFNTRIDEMRSASNPSVYNGYHSYTDSPAMLGASGTIFLTKYPVYHVFLVQNKRKTLLGLSSGFMLSQMPERTLMSN